MKIKYTKFRCKECNKILKRNMSLPENKFNLTKKGYKSFCSKTGKEVFCIKEN